MPQNEVNAAARRLLALRWQLHGMSYYPELPEAARQALKQAKREVDAAILELKAPRTGPTKLVP